MERSACTTTKVLEAPQIRQPMSAVRRSFLPVASLVGMATLLAGGARAQALTPGQEATQQLFYLVLVPAIAIGVLVMALVAYAVLKYRVRPGHTVGPVNAKTHDRKLESLWTVIPALILLVVGIASFQTLVVTDTIPPNPDVTVIVTARQWTWSFNVTYPNGTFTTPQAGVFTVQVGQVVKLVFESVDVAHAFSIPAYSLKVDVIPGRENVYWFKALAAGDFEIHCAEFCGLQHYAMVAMLHVDRA
jgi:cytochrome c oxidase subunit II